MLAIWSIVWAFLSKAWTTILTNKPLLYGLCIVIALAVSYGAGHHQAAKACKAAAIQSLLDAKKAELDKIQSDLTEAQKQIEALDAKDHQIETVTNTIIQKVPVYIKDNRACDAPAELIANINQLRAQ